MKWRGGLQSFETGETNPESDSEENVYIRKVKAEAFLKEQQGIKAEIEVQKLKNEVIDIEDAKQAISAVAINIKTLFLSLPSRLAPRLLGINSLVEVENIFKEKESAFLKVKNKKDLNNILSEIISEFNECGSIMEINNVTSQLVDEILTELSRMEVGNEN